MGRGPNCSLSELRARISISKFMQKSRQQKILFKLNKCHVQSAPFSITYWILISINTIYFSSSSILRVIYKSNYARNLSGICENLHQFFFALTSVKRGRGRGGHEWGCLGTIIELINHMPASNYHSPLPSNGPQSVVTSKLRQVSPDGMSNGMTWKTAGGGRGAATWGAMSLPATWNIPIFYWNAKFA